MERIEFFNSADGKVYFFCEKGEHKLLRIEEKNIIEYLYRMIEVIYPEALRALQIEYNESSKNYYFYRFRIVERFIRCNFGENDLLSYDIEQGTMHLEQVRCPLRNICKLEGVVCNPTTANNKETEVARLYAHGLSLREIADKLNKSAGTVNAQLYNLKKRLNLESSRELIKIFNTWE